MATKIIVELPGARDYAVRIGSGILDALGESMRSIDQLARTTDVLIVTDSNVAPLYLAQTKAALARAGFKAADVVVPAGEDSKSLEVAGEIWSAMAQLALGRDCAVVALGGGVVGDLAGFVAATYMRGIPLVHVPTTLLAMIDASVGGKTALDLPQGKNLVGAFKQPEYVCADLSTLSTLPSDQWASGLAELAKMAVVTSDDFFFWLSDHASDLADGRRALAEYPDVLAEAVTRAVAAKVDIIAADEYDTKGIRAQLNYGHTLGHALEALSGYSVAHGHAVAEGMRFAARLATAVCGTSLDVVAAQDALLDALAIPRVPLTPDAGELLPCMHGDKKTAAGAIRFVLPADIAHCSLHEVGDELLASHLAAWATQRKA